MGVIDSLISIAVVVTFLSFVGSKIYAHEKEHIDPLIKKIKGWFNKDSEEGGEIDSNEDFELSFKGIDRI